MVNATTTCIFGNPLIVNKSGAVITLIYPNATNQSYQFGTSTCVTVKDSETISIGTSTATNTAQFINGFSYGDVMIAFLLLIIVTNAFFGGILNRLLGARNRTQYKVKI